MTNIHPDDSLTSLGDIDLRISDRLVPYEEAHDFMEDLVAKIFAGEAREMIWLLQHPPLYTAGTSAKPDDLVDPNRFPVHDIGRGGEYTYHGPGQRVGYVMMNLKARKDNVRDYVHRMEAFIIDVLEQFNLKGEVRDGRVGVWIDTGTQEKKIAAIGIRVRRWVTFHGFSINVEPELDHFNGIIPCGLDPKTYGVTSFVDQGLPVTMHDVDLAIRKSFEALFLNRQMD